MKNYEAMFVFKPTVADDKLEKEIKSIERAIKTKGKGEVKYTLLGKKTLAYDVRSFREGIYVNFLFTAQPLAIAKIKGTLRHKEDILRTMFLIRSK